MFKSNLRTALLGSGAAVAMMAVAVPASADEMSELKAQIDALQGKLGTLEARQAATEKKTKVAPAAALEAGDKPRSVKWAGTNTSVSFSGYAKLDFIYDIGQSLGDSAFVAAASTGGGAASNVTDNFRAHARQSRLRFQSWTPTDWGELATHIEGDFEGSGGNQIVSNSNSFRLRHAFGRLGPVLAGQTWSTFMDISAWPETVDFHGPGGGLFVRQAQLRYTHSFGNGFRAQVAAENAEGFYNSSANVAVTNGNLDAMPDFAGNLRYSFDSGYLMLKGVVAYNRLDNGAGASDSEIGFGVSGSGVINLGPNDSVGFEVSYLYGTGRYMLFGTSNGNAVCSSTCATGADNLRNTSNLGGFVWYRHRWTDTMRSTVSYSGVVSHSNFAPATAGALENGHQIHANLVWSPVSQVNIGFEVQYWAVERDTGGNGTGNSSADGVRLQLGMQYNF